MQLQHTTTNRKKEKKERKMKLVIALFAFLAVASAAREDQLTAEQAASNSTSGVHIRFKHEYDDLAAQSKPSDVSALWECQSNQQGAPTFYPVGSCHWMTQQECSSSTTGMFWYTNRHTSIYARCAWINDECSFVSGAPSDSLCKYVWHQE